MLLLRFPGSLLSFVCCAVLPALAACGPSPCHLTGRNSVKGAVTVASSGETCVAEVSGRFDDRMGQMSISISCAPPTVADPRAKPSREFSIQLPDPRVLDATSPVTVTGGSRIARGPVDAKLEVLEAAGGKAPIPSGVTNDFVRHLVVRIRQTGAADVTADVTIRSNDLRAPEEYCVSD